MTYQYIIISVFKDEWLGKFKELTIHDQNSKYIANHKHYVGIQKLNITEL